MSYYLSAIFRNKIKLFLFSLSVHTGCGSIAPKSTWGKVATMGYASLGIPLTLVYLSSAGGLLSRCARGVFTRALCCCLCSNCGYCCYDERRMQVSGQRNMLFDLNFASPLDKKFNRRLPVFFPFKKNRMHDGKRICYSGSIVLPMHILYNG